MHFLHSVVALLFLLTTAHADPVVILSWEEAYAKADALINQMTLEQKVNITTDIVSPWSRCFGSTRGTTDPYFPQLCQEDSSLGVHYTKNVSVYAAGINAAASFDRDMIRQRAELMGSEFRRKGVNIQLGPIVDIMRVPTAGRNWEGFGEDPYLSGEAAAETVKGVQSQGVICVAKHFIGNQQETNRKIASTNIDDRTLHEVYLWPFARSVEADVGGVMCSYNKVNGEYACENDHTLNTILKHELGFKGFVMSDFLAGKSTKKGAINGLDLAMPGGISFVVISYPSIFGEELVATVESGDVPESRVTDMARRIVATWYKFGQDKDFPHLSFDAFRREKDEGIDVQEDHKVAIRQMGAASLVLLRNTDNILPLKDTTRKIAVIGSDGGPDPDGPNFCFDHACDRGTLAEGWGTGAADFPYLITPLDGIKARVADNVDVSYSLDNWDLQEAARTARSANVAIVFSNADGGEDYIIVDGNIGDRKNMSLWNNGNNLIQAVADANENTIVVIHAVGPVDMPWIDHPNIKAILWPGLPGQESGNSLADVLFGDVNPSGRLPYTLGQSENDYSSRLIYGFENNYREKLLVGYRWFDAKNIEPLFEFGFGLSYTNFEYERLSLDVKGHQVNASVSVINVGDRDGAEVVQAYLSFPESVHEPPKVLRGFEKVYLKAGEQAQAHFSLGKTELSYWETKKKAWVVPEGQFMLHIGASSRDIRMTHKFYIYK
ncbi:hypothetical protein DFQ28_002120 [Apophysomyces sp. BC1034]|nr:hypothetical protein DFQ30_010349 [Apophysomyces sp. BC1015]KAG0183551.1 hypothetical protein DFQ29_002606 [Apophysomyces sp. BC1021]KAG0194011.1 hypothetical protein DFQ28_002120 [Apophysomyces sp. BC1034]